MYPLFLQRFGNAVAAHRDKPAILFGTQQISYAELDVRSAEIAQAITAQGVKRGDVVPIVLPRGIEAVCAILGVLKAGAAFCVTDPNYPDERIRFILEDTQAALVLNESSSPLPLGKGKDEGSKAFHCSPPHPNPLPRQGRGDFAICVPSQQPIIPPLNNLLLYQSQRFFQLFLSGIPGTLKNLEKISKICRQRKLCELYSD